MPREVDNPSYVEGLFITHPAVRRIRLRVLMMKIHRLSRVATVGRLLFIVFLLLAHLEWARRDV
jgi:hypothetical protein